ncbi:nicotianamine synthase family protein [Metabacillus idriensis]|uniref:nicotianamine synthase family protein n=1 Tax=Metabacillus idriensis TaxID=324768 RepID=UPI00174DAD5E|nr:nicotianamine synthase family protein [Metabacillus idriensis]
MSDKYAFLFSIKMLQHEIAELSAYISESKYCYELLTRKLDELSKFVVNEMNDRLWRLWGEDEEIRKYSEKLRETSSKAISTMEKYQSACTANQQMDISDYLTALSDSVKKELDTYEITNCSKVVFIGSGAFPLSALTIAKETGAQIICLDIDREAVEMGQNIAEITGLETSVSFTQKPVNQLPNFKDTTHVIIASLVKKKLEILEDLKSLLPESAKVIIRYGNGLKSIFNYPLDDDLSAEWDQEQVEQKNHFYDTLVLKRGTDNRYGRDLEYL